jgi:hypothetical protein
MRSLWALNIVDKPAILRVFDFTNRVLSTLTIGKALITWSISLWAIVARLSVITTESVGKPDC